MSGELISLQEQVCKAIKAKYWDRNYGRISELVDIPRVRLWNLFEREGQMKVAEYEKLLRFLPYFKEKVKRSRFAFFNEEERERYYNFYKKEEEESLNAPSGRPKRTKPKNWVFNTK